MKLTRLFISILFIISIDAQAFASDCLEAKREILITGNIGSADGEFGLKTFEDMSWVEPSAIAIDKKGNIYIADPLNDRIQKFNAEGKYLSKIIFKVQKKSFALTIDDISIDDKDNLYVLSRHEQKIYRYNPLGQLADSIKLQDYIQAERLSVDLFRNIYVFGMDISGPGYELRKFNENGSLLKKWKKVTVYFIDPEGHVFIRQDATWKKYDKNDKYIGDVKCEKEPLKVNFPAPEDGCHFPPDYIDINGNSYFYVLVHNTSKLKSILKFDKNGKLKSYNVPSVDIGQTSNMIKFDNAGNLYAYESSKEKYYVMRLSLK